MIRVKGTELYMLHGGHLEKIACVSAISGLAETMALRGRATLCEDENFEASGFPKFSTVNFTSRLSFDSSRLLVLQRNRTVVKLIVGFGDSTAQPVNYSGLTLPAGRTWIEMEGQFIGFGLDVPEGSIVQTPITFKVSSQIQITPVVPITTPSLLFNYLEQSYMLADKNSLSDRSYVPFKAAHTVTRASAGSTINAMREIVSVPANEPRFTHDILTGAPLGLLVEEQRTRLNTVSLLPTTAETITVTAVAHTVSFYGTGEITISGTHSAVLQGTGSGRVTLTFTPTAGALTITPTGSVNHLQLEAGADATSVILGEGSAVTRSADSVTHTVGAEYNTTEGTFIVKIAGRNAAFLEGLGHSNVIVSGTGTYVFRYNETDAWVHAPNSDTLRYGRQQLDSTLLMIARAGMAKVKDVVYIPRDVGADYADSIKAGDAVFVYDVGSSHYARTSFSENYLGKSISLIPTGLFDNTPLAAYFISTFHSNQLESIPEGLFDNTPLADNFGSTFRNNQLESIPEGLFDNTPLADNFAYTFRDNQLTSIPTGLFDNTPLVTNFYAAFQNNQLTSVPAGLFDAQTICTNYTNCFNGNNLTQQSVDNVLVSVAYSASTNNLSGGTLGLSGGTNATPSATGLAAKATLEGLGWTVTHN